MTILLISPGQPPRKTTIDGTLDAMQRLCAAPPDSENFESLTDDQLDRYAQIFRTPELFLSGPGGSIIVLPLPV